jgi:hypothetical protein
MFHWTIGCTYKSAWYYIPQDQQQHLHDGENLTSLVVYLIRSLLQTDQTSTEQHIVLLFKNGSARVHHTVSLTCQSDIDVVEPCHKTA